MSFDTFFNHNKYASAVAFVLPKLTDCPFFGGLRAFGDMGALFLLASRYALKGWNLIWSQEMSCRLPLSSIETVTPVHAMLERKKAQYYTLRTHP